MTGTELQKVEKYTRELLESADPQHTFDHVDRVRNNALKIVKQLNIKDLDSNLLQAACLLHDVPSALFHHSIPIKHWFEYFAVIKYLPGILKSLDVTEEEYGVLFNSIKRHIFSTPYRRLNGSGDSYTKILQDADTIDFFSYESEKSLHDNRSRHFSYRIMLLVSDRFLKYGRRNLGKYLNYPELAEYKWYETRKDE